MSIITYTKEFTLPKTLTLAKWLVFIGIVCLMLYVRLMNKCFFAAILLFLFSGAYVDKWKVLLKDKLILNGLLLVLIFTIGVFYSAGSWHYSLRAWDKSLKILYLFFFLPFFSEKSVRSQAIFFLLLGVMISEIFTYLHYFNVMSFGMPSSKHWLFVQDIDASFIVSYAAFVLANLAIDNKKLRWLNLFCFLICSIDVMLLNQERTGYLIYLALAGLFLWQRLGRKGLMTAFIVIPMVFAGFYLTTHKFNDRINQIVSDVSNYQQGNRGTSIGLRLSFAEYSFKVIRQHLIFGAGPGSFDQIYQSMNGPKINNETWPSHPHNEYISILFQVGIVGLLIFLYWIFLQIRLSFQLQGHDKILFQGLLLGFLLLGFCNASLLVNPAGACYMTFLALFLASKYDARKLEKCE